MKGWIPLFILFGLSALSLKYSQASHLTCLACSTENPSLTLLGILYFLALLTLFLFFPKFPKSKLSKYGLFASLGLASYLTYQNAPSFCLLCLIAHTCNLVIWTLWLLIAQEHPSFKKRFSISLFSILGIATLLTCLHLIFPSPQFKKGNLSKGLHVINFVSPDCVYCKDQLPVLDEIAVKLKDYPCRFINVASSSVPELMSHAMHTEWLEDQNGTLHEQFHVTAYPTTIVLESDGTVIEVFQGLSHQLFELLKTLK